MSLVISTNFQDFMFFILSEHKANFEFYSFIRLFIVTPLWLTLGVILRCTHGSKIQGGGSSSNFYQNPWEGVKAFRKNWQGVLFLVFIAFLLTSFSKICLGGCFFTPITSVCLYGRDTLTRFFYLWSFTREQEKNCTNKINFFSWNECKGQYKVTLPFGMSSTVTENVFTWALVTLT
jgi:hypothetical protein